MAKNTNWKFSNWKTKKKLQIQKDIQYYFEEFSFARFLIFSSLPSFFLPVTSCFPPPISKYFVTLYCQNKSQTLSFYPLPWWQPAPALARLEETSLQIGRNPWGHISCQLHPFVTTQKARAPSRHPYREGTNLIQAVSYGWNFPALSHEVLVSAKPIPVFLSSCTFHNYTIRT